MATAGGVKHIVRYVNPAFCRLMAKPTEQIVGRPFGDLLPSKDQCVRLLDRVFRTGKPENHTEQEHFETHPLFWSYTMWPVLAEAGPEGVMILVTETAEFHGKMVAMNQELMLRSLRQHELTEVAVASNALLQKEVTERKRVEAALRESEERYRTLFDLGPVAIYSCNASGVIEKFNRRAEKLWGRKPAAGDTSERFCGSLKLFHPDGSFMPHARCPMAEVVGGKKAVVHNAEAVIERPDGSRVIVVVNIRPLTNKQGKITGAINCFYDITERKQAEEAQRRMAVLAATNRKLELEIAQRRTAEQALKKSEQHQGRLLDEYRRMRDELRLLSRQLLHAQEEERKRISRDLHDVIAQALLGINLQLATLKKDAGTNAKDRNRRLARTQDLVAQEAIANVGRHANANKVELSIRKLAGAMCMRISDDGKGFPAQKAGRDQKNKRLGLLGMRERLEMVGGSFDIESTQGKGTTVTAQIPLRKALRGGVNQVQ